MSNKLPLPPLLQRMRDRELGFGEYGKLTRSITAEGSARGAIADISATGSAPSEQASGVTVISKTFPYQSYFSSALMERAILPQPADPIVVSTKAEVPTPGWGVGLYSASEAPIAVHPVMGAGGSGGPTFIVRPGEAYRMGKSFTALRYGLPFGWLGGGTVQLRIFQGQQDSPSFATMRSEVLFHRVRLPVFALADNPLVTARGASPNWPNALPWPNAFSNNNDPQGAMPSLSIAPTKIIVRLRKATLVGGARLRLLIVKTDDLDLQSDGVTFDDVATSGTWFDIQWPEIVASGFHVGGAATVEYPIATLNDQILRIGGASATAFFIDMDGTIGNTTFVDVERYGIL